MKFLINKYYTIHSQKTLIITNTLYIINSLLVRIKRDNYLLDDMIEDFK